MAKKEYPEILFGRIALMLNFVSPARLAECVMVQENANPPKKLGAIMVEKGYLTPEQMAEVLSIQQQNLQTSSPHSEQRLEDTIMGKLIVKHGFATMEQVNEAIRLQALREQEGDFYRLGEVMVQKGFMTVLQVLDVLKIQHKQIMVCPGCGSKFNVASFKPGYTYKCKRCKALLKVPAFLESVDVDTTIFLPNETGSCDESRAPDETH